MSLTGACSARAAFGALALAVMASNAAGQIDPLQQPRGTPIAGLPGVPSITTGIDANAVPTMPAPPTQPWDNTQPAGVIRTTEPVEYYVRVYSPPDSVANRAFIMRASTIRGLTPEQIRDRFALPFLPTFVTNVIVPSGTCLLSGIAGPILGHFPAGPNIPTPGPWGAGGAQQTWIAGADKSANCTTTDFLPPEDYTNRRPIGANALWYAPVVASGNPFAVGAYLDHLPAPAEYSDLFNAYNTLDLLNDGTATRLRPALQEIAGESYAAANIIAVDATDRFARRLVDHARDGLSEPFDTSRRPARMLPSGPTKAAADSGASPSNWWLIGGGEFGRASGNDDRAGYHFDAATTGVGYDRRFSPDAMAGLALAYEHTGFSVDRPSNSGSIDTARAAAYGAAAVAGLRFAGVGAVSFDQFDVSRSLPTFSRTASSSYDGWTLAFSGEASRPFAVGTATLEPLAGLSMVQAWRAGFTEAGAGALSLSVERGDFTKVASRLGAEFGLRWAVSDGVLLRPWLRGAWAHDFADAVSDFSASLAGAIAPGTFTIQSVDTGRDAALLSAGFTLDLSARASITVAYQGELRHDAQAHSISGTGTLRW